MYDVTMDVGGIIVTQELLIDHIFRVATAKGRK
jgi:hypothetical protein